MFAFLAADGTVDMDLPGLASRTRVPAGELAVGGGMSGGGARRVPEQEEEEEEDDFGRYIHIFCLVDFQASASVHAMFTAKGLESEIFPRLQDCSDTFVTSLILLQWLGGAGGLGETRL